MSSCQFQSHSAMRYQDNNLTTIHKLFAIFQTNIVKYFSFSGGQGKGWVGLPSGNISCGVWISLSIIIHYLIDSFIRCGNLNHYRTSILVLHQGTVIETLISLNLTVGKRFPKRLSDSFRNVVMRHASHLSVGKLLCHCLCWPNTNSQTYYTYVFDEITL